MPDTAARKDRRLATKLGKNLWEADNLGMDDSLSGIFVSLVLNLRCTKWAGSGIPSNCRAFIFRIAVSEGIRRQV
jgi:hypothetical protein